MKKAIDVTPYTSIAFSKRLGQNKIVDMKHEQYRNLEKGEV